MVNRRLRGQFDFKVWGPSAPYAFKTGCNSSWSIPNGSAIFTNWSESATHPTGLFDTNSKMNNQVWFPGVAGKYYVESDISINNTSSTFQYTYIVYLNKVTSSGTLIVGGQIGNADSHNVPKSSSSIFSVSGDVDLAADEGVAVFVGNSYSTGGTVYGNISDYTYFLGYIRY